MGDVGDGDRDDPAAAVPRVGVRLGIDGVVVVAGVDGVDGDEGRDAADPCGLRGRALSPRRPRSARLREVVGDAVGVHGDQADRPLVLRVAEPLNDARLRRRSGPVRRARSARGRRSWRRSCACWRRPLLQLLAVDGLDDAAAACEGAEDAEQAPLLARQPLDRPRLVASIDVGSKRRDARQDAVADARQPAPCRCLLSTMRMRGVRPAPRPRRRAWRSARRRRRARRSRARSRAAARPGAGACGLAREQPLVGHLAQQLLQSDAVAALDAEGARDLALAGLPLAPCRKSRISCLAGSLPQLFGLWERSWSWPRLLS